MVCVGWIMPSTGVTQLLATRVHDARLEGQSHLWKLSLFSGLAWHGRHGALLACTCTHAAPCMQMATVPGLAWVSAMYDITSQPALPPLLRLPPGKQPAIACNHA